MKYEICIKRSIEYIEKNLDKKIELKELADRVFMSQYHFHRVFHAAVGEPVGEYIRKRRLTEAAKELVNTEQKIVDIALKYQFGSQETFSKAFKKLYGLPPKEFRRTAISAVQINGSFKISKQPSMAA
jgi:AraC family transcriptional regulator